MSKNTNVSCFEEFLDYVRDHIKDYVEGIDDFQVRIIPMVKNNQVVIKGLQIADPRENHAPVYYLEVFYEALCRGMELDEIMEAIAYNYEASKHMKGCINPDSIYDFKEMKDRIILRLVNAERNESVLNQCPHRFMADLAVTYRVLAGINEGGISTFLVSDDLMDEWGVNEQVLYDLACENSLCLFPPVVEKLHDMMRNSFGVELSRVLEEADYKEAYTLYILTNDIKLNGASTVCYSDALEWFSKKIGCDFYVIPSSIHEMLLLSVTSDIDPAHLQAVIREVNERMVLEEEILSDNLYFYSAKDKKLRKYYAS